MPAVQPAPSQNAETIRTQSPDAHAYANAGHGGSERLIEAWRHEFMHVAMMTAFVTMGCNTLAEHASLKGLAAVEINLPEEPAIYRAVSQGLLEMPRRYSAALLAAQSSYDYLGVAMDVFRLASEQQPGDGGVTPVGLANSWRAACREFLTALDVFDANGLLRVNAGSASALNSQCPRRLMQLLRAANAGETLASSGLGHAAGSALPDWVQRRRWDRRNVNMKCMVSLRGGDRPAVVRNLSMGGALLDEVPALVRGARIIITLDAGRQLSGTVMWSRGATAGIKFESQLLYDDPLIDAGPEDAGPE